MRLAASLVTVVYLWQNRWLQTLGPMGTVMSGATAAFLRLLGHCPPIRSSETVVVTGGQATAKASFVIGAPRCTHEQVSDVGSRKPTCEDLVSMLII